MLRGIGFAQVLFSGSFLVRSGLVPVGHRFGALDGVPQRAFSLRRAAAEASRFTRTRTRTRARISNLEYEYRCAEYET